MSEEAIMSVPQIILAVVVVGVLVLALLWVVFEGKVVRGSCKIFIYTLYYVSQVQTFGAQATLQAGLAGCDKYQY